MSGYDKDPFRDRTLIDNDILEALQSRLTAAERVCEAVIKYQFYIDGQEIKAPLWDNLLYDQMAEALKSWREVKDA